MSIWLGLAIASVVVVLALALQHYFDWHRWIGHELRAPWTYVLGVVVLASVYTAWVLLGRVEDATVVTIGLWAIVGAGGVAVLACYGLDILGGVIQDWRTSKSGTLHGPHGDRLGTDRQSERRS